MVFPEAETISARLPSAAPGTGGTTVAPMATLVEAAQLVTQVIEMNADEGERLRRLPAASVEALTRAGLLRMCVPAAYGGPEADPITLVTAIETVAQADGAAGWCSMIASTTSSMAAFLPASTASQIYGDPQVVTGGVFAPNGTGVAQDPDGFSVTGRWAWGSGTQHCQWILGGANCSDGTFRLCWFPQSEVTFHDTWHTSGMRGSGSLDYSVDRTFVPADFTMQPGVSEPTVESPLARFPLPKGMLPIICATPPHPITPPLPPTTGGVAGEPLTLLRGGVCRQRPRIYGHVYFVSVISIIHPGSPGELLLILNRLWVPGLAP